MLRTAAVLSVLALGASAKEPEYVDAPEDQYQKSELDAMSQVAGSEKMKGMKFGKREVAKDGMSGRILPQAPGPPRPPPRPGPAAEDDVRTTQESLCTVTLTGLKAGTPIHSETVTVRGIRVGYAYGAAFRYTLRALSNFYFL